MPKTRKGRLSGLLRGLIIAILITLLGMLLIAAAITWLHLPEKSIRGLNQLIKAVAVALGCCAAIRRGGDMGLVTGTVLALFYMLLGYGMYLGLGGGDFSASSMLGEMLISCAIGAVTGTIRANLPSRKRA